MKNVFALMCIGCLIFGMVGIACAEDKTVLYEMPVFEPDKPQLPGAHLRGPGDTYRYTFFIDDEYYDNPNWKIKNVLCATHILDGDWNEKTGDGAKEWGRILIAGKALKWINLPLFEKQGYRKGQTPQSCAFIEIESDREVGMGGNMPPYIFDITDLIKKQRSFTFEVTNLRSDGSIHSDAPFGDFLVLRMGYRVTYTPVK